MVSPPPGPYRFEGSFSCRDEVDAVRIVYLQEETIVVEDREEDVVSINAHAAEHPLRRDDTDALELFDDERSK